MKSNKPKASECQPSRQHGRKGWSSFCELPRGAWNPSLCLAALIVCVILAGGFIFKWSGEVIPNLKLIDSLSMLAINFHGDQYFNCFFYNLSSKFIWAPLIIAIIYAIGNSSTTWKQALIIILLSVAVVALCDQGSGLIKHFAERGRPFRNPNIKYMLFYVNGYHGGRFGFVSSHAANCFGEAAWLTLLFRNKWTKISLFALAVVVCYTRIFLGVHYPFDVLGGAILGVIIGAAVYAVCLKLLGRRNCILADRHNAIGWTTAFTVAALAVISAFNVYL